MAFTRTWEGDSVLCAANAGDRPTILTVDGSWAEVGGAMAWPADGTTGQASIQIPPMTGCLLRRL